MAVSGENAVAKLDFGVNQSNLPDNLVPALQRICEMWRTNNRLLQLLRRKYLRTRDVLGAGPPGHLVGVQTHFSIEIEERKISIDLTIMSGGLLPEEFLVQLRETLIATFAKLMRHPQKDPNRVFFQLWRT